MTAYIVQVGNDSNDPDQKNLSDYRAVGIACFLGAGMLLIFPESSLAQCAPPAGAITVDGATCSEANLTRSHDVSGGHKPVVSVENGGSYTGTDMYLENSAGNNGHGLEVKGIGSTAELVNSTVLTEGPYAFGIKADKSAKFTGENITIQTSGDNSDAITIENGGTVTLKDAVLITSGSNAEGIQAKKESYFIGSNIKIQTDSRGSTDPDDGADGVVLADNSYGVLENSSITTFGTDSVGVWVTGGGNRDNPGVPSSFTARNIQVETFGKVSSGFYVDTGSDLTVDGGTVIAHGDDGSGLTLANGGIVTFTDVDTTAKGANSSAIVLKNERNSDPGSITINGGSLTSENGPLIRAESGIGSIILNGPVSLSAGNVAGRTVLAEIRDGSDVNFAADLELRFDGVSGVSGDIVVSGANHQVNTDFLSSDWTGDLQVLAGNVLNLGLANSEWTGQSLGATSIAVDAASIWNMTESSDSGIVTNAGHINFVLTDTFSTLTVNNYDGRDGFLGLNTFLGADASPSDRLVIDGGTASGTSGVIIANAGGPGAQTTGDGIRVVETVAGGATETDAFYLASRAAAGAYEYLLFRGGESGEDDWFLRSHLATDVSGQEIPLYRPEVPLYAPVPAMARHMGLAFLGTLHERVGEQMNIKHQPDQNEYANGVWTRMIGEVGSSKWSGTVDVKAHDAHLWGIQAGLDIYRAEHSNGHRDHAGIYGGYTNYSADISGFALGVNDLRVGKLKLDGPVVGAYWTHYTPAGSYLDGVVQWNWFDAVARSDYGTGMETRGTGFAASIEAGHPFAMGDGWQIEPQAQLIYQTVSVKGSSDSFSALGWKDDDAVTGRLGVRMQFTSDDEGKVWQPYVKANLWHRFNGTDRMVLDSNIVETRFGNTSLDLGVGMTAKLTETASLYGHVDHRWSVGGAERQSTIGGALGLRVNW